MRPTLLLALAVAQCAACANESAPSGVTPAGSAWLSDRPENAHPYADDTLARFVGLVAEEGWRDPTWSAHGTLEAVHEKTGLVFVLVPAGEFLMGSEGVRLGYLEGPIHSVSVPAFMLCRTECTQEAWDRAQIEDDREWRGPQLPIEYVSWPAARKWCAAMTLRLPSEAEWEYACRAGSSGKWCFGSDDAQLGACGWFRANSGRDRPSGRNGEGQTDETWSERECRTHAVAAKTANAWGLHDMHGNVWEWCEDRWHDYGEPGRPDDGRAWTDGNAPSRVARGGSFYVSAAYCRSAFRHWDDRDFRFHFVGFRPARSLPK
jgi:formylglycine-generating enzyme required for sulfatase activity